MYEAEIGMEYKLSINGELQDRIFKKKYQREDNDLDRIKQLHYPLFLAESERTNLRLGDCPDYFVQLKNQRIEAQALTGYENKPPSKDRKVNHSILMLSTEFLADVWLRQLSEVGMRDMDQIKFNDNEYFMGVIRHELQHLVDNVSPHRKHYFGVNAKEDLLYNVINEVKAHFFSYIPYGKFAETDKHEVIPRIIENIGKNYIPSGFLTLELKHLLGEENIALTNKELTATSDYIIITTHGLDESINEEFAKIGLANRLLDSKLPTLQQELRDFTERSANVCAEVFNAAPGLFRIPGEFARTPHEYLELCEYSLQELPKVALLEKSP